MSNWTPELETLRERCHINADGCWIWKGDRYSNGQPRAQVEPVPSRKRMPAKRLALRLSGKREPTKWGTCRCDLDPVNCINPDHLRNFTRSRVLKQSNQENRAAHMVRIARSITSKRSASSDMTMELARELRASGDTAKVLAERYGIPAGRAKAIRNGRLWKEIGGLGGVFNG